MGGGERQKEDGEEDEADDVGDDDDPGLEGRVVVEEILKVRESHEVAEHMARDAGQDVA